MSTKELKRPTHSQFLKQIFWTKERKILYGNLMKEKWKDLNFRNKTNGQRNKVMKTKNYHDNLSNAQKKRLENPENKKEFETRIKLAQSVPDYGKKISLGLKLAHENPKLRQKKREIALNLWQNKDFVKKVHKNRNTKIERIMKSSLEDNNLEFENNIPVKLSQYSCVPDHLNINLKMAIFDDGKYWHNKPKTIEKDKRITKELEGLGWKVLRFSDEEILNNVQSCVDEIKTHYLYLNALA